MNNVMNNTVINQDLNEDSNKTLHIATTQQFAAQVSYKKPKLNFLKPLRDWLNSIEVKQTAFAHRICQLIPAQCPFERNIKLGKYTIIRIPPLCKLNPLYDEVVALRFRALCYLADKCGEDISSYC